MDFLTINFLPEAYFVSLSWMQTIWPSFVSLKSASMASAPCFHASWKAGIVFSGVWAEEPRWATINGSAAAKCNAVRARILENMSVRAFIWMLVFLVIPLSCLIVIIKGILWNR